MSRLSAALFTLSGLLTFTALGLWTAAVWTVNVQLFLSGLLLFLTAGILCLAAVGHDILAEQ